MTNRPSSPPQSTPGSALQGPASGAPETSTAQFEGAMKRLGEIVQTLEKGELPLEETLGLFEEGVRLAAAAQGKLDVAQKRVEELLAVDESGRPRVAPFSLREE